MGYVLSKVVAEPFTNSIGQTIHPGDDVVVVTTGRCNSVNVFTGKFAGVRFDKINGNMVGTAVSQIPVTCNERVFSENGSIEEERYIGWHHGERRHLYEKTGRRYDLVKKVGYRKSSLQRNRLFKIDTPLTDIKI